MRIRLRDGGRAEAQPTETAAKPQKGAGTSKDDPFDYFHVKSVAEDADGSLLS